MKKLKDLREKRSLTQKDLAYEIGVTQECISQWENGISKPTYFHLKVLSSYFGVNADVFLESK